MKVSQTVTPIEQREPARRAARSEALQLSRVGNLAGLVTFLRGAGAKQGLDAEAVLECAAEHEDAAALSTALKAAFQLEQPDVEQTSWIAEKRAEVLLTIRRRRR